MKTLLAFFATLVTILSPGIQTAPTPPVDTFITLAESTTFGPGGTIFDYSTRVWTPTLSERPDTSTWTVDSSFRDDVCTSDNTTMSSIWTAFSTGSDSKVVYLPDACKVRRSVAVGTGQTIALDFPVTADFRMLACHPDATNCGITYYPQVNTGVAALHWDWNVGAVERNAISGYAMRIGTGSADPAATCTWTAGFGINEKVIVVNGCALISAWGVGDIVVLDSIGDPNTDDSDWDWRTRITCVDLAGSGQTNATGSDCTGLSGDLAQIKIRDGLPRNYANGAYYWGNTTSRTVGISESVGSARGGVGAGTDVVPEGIWFSNIEFDWELDMLWDDGQYVRIINAADSGIVDSTFLACAESCITTGIAGGGGPVKTLFAGNSFEDEVFQNTCFSEIVSVTATNPAVVRVLDGCNLGSASAYLEFSPDASEPFLAGQTFLRSGSVVSNGDGTVSVTLLGVNGSAFTTAGGGLLAQQEDFNMATTYCNNNSVMTQIVDNAFIGVRQGPLYQGGCVGYVGAFNYSNNDNEHGARFFFGHSNNGAPGTTIEGNDSDLTYVPYASSNADPGEGTNVTYFKNRGRSYGVSSWPPGTSTTPNYACGGSGGIGFCEQINQVGATNEDWNFFLNAFTDIGNSATLIDCSSNAGGAGCGSVLSAPYMLHSLAWYRNRTHGASANQDDNFDLFGVTPNPTTLTDVTGSNTNGTNYEDDDVPAAYSAEIGLEPTSIVYDHVPPWWCNESGTFGQMGAYYDDFNGGTLTKLPAQIRYEGTTCTLP